MTSEQKKTVRAAALIVDLLRTHINSNRTKWQIKFGVRQQLLDAAITKATADLMVESAEASGVMGPDEAAATRQQFTEVWGQQLVANGS